MSKLSKKTKLALLVVLLAVVAFAGVKITSAWLTDTNKNEILCNKIVSGKLLVKELVNLDDNELQEIINKMINIADLEEHKEVDNVQEII